VKSKSGCFKKFWSPHQAKMARFFPGQHEDARYTSSFMLNIDLGPSHGAPEGGSPVS